MLICLNSLRLISGSKFMRAYLFFARTYNDWDHIAPIIWYLSHSVSGGPKKISVIFYRDDLRKTESYEYLAKMLGDKFETFSDVPNQKLRSFLKRIVRKLGGLFGIVNIGAPVTYTSEKKLQYYLSSLGLAEYDKVVAVFDRTLNPVVGYVRKALQGLPAVFVSVPHGPMTNANRLCYVNDFKQALPSDRFDEYFKNYDYVVFSDSIEKEIDDKCCRAINRESASFSDFNESGKRRVLGSLRYSDEWLRQMDVYAKPFLAKNSKRPMVSFFMKKFQHNVFVDEVFRTIQIFAAHSEIDFYIKPHTRGQTARGIGLTKQYDNIYIAEDESSTSLIHRSDLILFYGGTSIILEALARGKVVACIDYLDCNRNIYEFYEACSILKSRDDLYAVLADFQADRLPNFSPERLIDDMVYVGDRSISVSKRYVEFLESL